jgi:hypothetical protein
MPGAGNDSITPYASRRCWKNQGEYEDAPGNASGTSRRWCKRGSESLGLGFAYGNMMILAIYTYTMEDTQDSATAALEEAFSCSGC